jgi:MFS family permease
MCLIWFSCSGIYNGMTLGIKSLPGDIYINGILLFGVELISYILSGVLMDWPLLGRKKTAIITLFLSAFFMLFLVIFIENDTCSVIFYMIIRVCITIPFTEFYTYCLEIYPTSVRGIGFGINAVCNNIGGIVVPMVLELLSSRVIYIIFTVMCGVCGLLFFTMEETVGKPMPETIKEIEEEEIKNKIEMEQMQQISI